MAIGRWQKGLDCEPYEIKFTFSFVPFLNFSFPIFPSFAHVSPYLFLAPRATLAFFFFTLTDLYGQT